MKTRKIFSLLLLLWGGIACGQNENNIWCFGNGAGLDFNGGAPAAIGSAVNTVEGTSSIADASGNLLFYTDGITVWNSNHIPMPNGTGLTGGISSTQSALIVKQPGSASLYYIFTTAEAQGIDGFGYSIVDMTLQSGLGDVTVKNIQLFTPSAEKVCGTYHSNGTDIWVLGHEFGTDIFRAYLLTSTGLNTTPVFSAVGQVHTAGGAEIGYMRFSPNGQHVALAIRYQFVFQLFDFDNTAGVVSNSISIPSNGNIAYGVEFSPDNTKLYLADVSQLSQCDITSNDSTLINNSKTFIGMQQWALQLGPDQKIYAANYLGATLGVINDPNNAGAACNYVPNAIPLLGTSTLGLPNSIWRSNLMPIAIFTSANHICPGTCTDFVNHSMNATSYQWSFPGAIPATSTDVNPTGICYNTPGSYSVTLIASNSNGSDTLMLPL